MIRSVLLPVIILTTSLLLFSFPSVSQQRITVYGRVFDGGTGSPIRHANVFFNNTTLSAVTDSMGVYKIENVPAGLNEIVASSVGYITQVQILHSPDKRPVVFFKMRPDAPQSIVGPPRREPVVDEKEWNNLYIRFKQAFLGQDTSARHMEILNPSALRFELSTTEIGVFFANSGHPLEVLNQSLGYKLLISLIEFRASKTSYNMLFRTQFDTLKSGTALDKRRWQQNRIDAYKGSPRHFFKSVRQGRLTEEGFSVYVGQIKGPYGRYSYQVGDIPAPPAWIYVDSAKTKFKVLKRGLYQVNYMNSYIQKNERYFKNFPFPVSWIDVKDSYVTLDSLGQPVLPADFSFLGFMNSYRGPEMLPLDYERPNRIEVATKPVTLRGTVQDENNVPLSEVEVFVNGGLNHAITDDEGRFEIHNLYPGKYPLAFAHPEMEQLLMNINLSSSDENGILIHLKEKISPLRTIDEFNQRREKEWRNLMHFFESKLCQGNNNARITNPYALIINISGKNIHIQTTSPLEIEDKSLGYRWTYFMDSASLIKTNGGYRLRASGLVKMETISSRSEKEVYRRQSGRFEEYIGSWNHFTQALMAGKAEKEGFKLYQLIKQPADGSGEWKKMTKDDPITITSDAMIITEKEKFSLQIPKGFEIHYEGKKDEMKMYDDYPYRVMRVDAGPLKVPITIEGIVGPVSCDLSETRKEFLPKVPVDYYLGGLNDPDSGRKPFLIKKTSNVYFRNR